MVAWRLFDSVMFSFTTFLVLQYSKLLTIKNYEKNTNSIVRSQFQYYWNDFESYNSLWQEIRKIEINLFKSESLHLWWNIVIRHANSLLHKYPWTRWLAFNAILFTPQGLCCTRFSRVSHLKYQMIVLYHLRCI